MKTFALVFLCSLSCVACARPLNTLSDGQPGYIITCDTLLERCLNEIKLACRGKSYTIIAERDQEFFSNGNWGSRRFHNWYTVEARCEQP